jgi:hypothetical protein
LITWTLRNLIIDRVRKAINFFEVFGALNDLYLLLELKLLVSYRQHRR